MYLTKNCKLWTKNPSLQKNFSQSPILLVNLHIQHQKYQVFLETLTWTLIHQYVVKVYSFLWNSVWTHSSLGIIFSIKLRPCTKSFLNENWKGELPAYPFKSVTIIGVISIPCYLTTKNFKTPFMRKHWHITIKILYPQVYSCLQRGTWLSLQFYIFWLPDLWTKRFKALFSATS